MASDMTCIQILAVIGVTVVFLALAGGTLGGFISWES